MVVHGLSPLQPEEVFTARIAEGLQPEEDREALAIASRRAYDEGAVVDRWALNCRRGKVALHSSKRVGKNQKLALLGSLK